MNQNQINIVINAQKNLDKLSDWQKGFIKKLYDKPITEPLSLTEDAQLNVIAERLSQ